jgi:CspA family cold shock protein
MPKGFATLTTNVTATVKFFDLAKGYGFVEPEEGSGDAFLSAAVLEQSGQAPPGPGDVLVCDLMRGPKGRVVAAVYEARAAVRTARQPSGRHGRRPDPPRAADPPAGPVEGRVLWFNPAKGFGFIAPDAGGTDVFVHGRTVAEAGLPGLAEHQRVRFTWRSGDKGPQVERIELA